MSNPMITENEQALLGAVVSGERDEHNPQVQELLQRRPELRAQLAKLQPLAARLESLGGGERRSLGEDSRKPSALDGQVRDMLEAAQQRRQQWRTRWWFGAAAAVLLASILFWMLRRSEPTGPQLLGAPQPGEIVPAGVIAQAQEFRWNAPLPAGGRYVVLCYAQEISAASLLFEYDVGDNNRWTVTQEQRALMRGKMVLVVQVRDKTNGIVGGAGPVRISLPP